MELSESKRQGVIILGLKGRLDASNAASLEGKVLSLVAAGETRLVFDLAQLDYISSAGLRVLLMAAKRLMRPSGQVALAAPQEHVKEVFEIAGFSSILKIYPSRDAALVALQ